MNLINIFAKTFLLLRQGDFKTLKNKIVNKHTAFLSKREYRKWLKKNGSLNAETVKKIESEIESFVFRPKISIILPVYNVEEKWLRLCIESVLNQIYKNWELCIADDCSPAPHIRSVLEKYAANDERIKVVFRRENGHISAASNSALELASGEFTALLDHDDEISTDALFCVVKELNEYPETSFIYSDEDMIDERGTRYEPKFKPDFARDLFYSVNYLTHLAVYRTEILRKIGGFRLGAEGSQDYDLALRVIEQISEKQIRHIPRVLYHWRAIRGSAALSANEKPYAHERAREALGAHLKRTGKSAKVTRSIWNWHRVRYDLPSHLPKVNLMIYSENKFEPNFVQDWIYETDYDNLQTILITEGSAEKLNAATAKDNGEILVFADANLKPLTKDWLKELVSFAVQTEIGAVGAKIISQDKAVSYGGLILGTHEIISAARCDFSAAASENPGRNRLTGTLAVNGNFSAVSIACFAVRRKLFEEIGGFDFENLPNRFFDADFCLKLREKDYRIVFTTYAELQKIDDKKRLNFELNASAEEKEYFVKKWSKTIENDPFYNPNLSKKDGSFSIDI